MAKQEKVNKTHAVKEYLRGSLQIKVLQLQGGGTLGLSS